MRKIKPTNNKNMLKLFIIIHRLFQITKFKLKSNQISQF
jgi:hypothetical protein